MLENFISQHQEELVRRARAKVASRRSPHTTDAELKYGVPLFLKQLTAILHRNPPQQGAQQEPEIGEGAVLHSRELLRMGLNVNQVVHAYGDVCQAITELALEAKVTFDTEDFRTLNRCLDDAIAAAATEYVQGHDGERNIAQSELERERLGVFAHELRNLISTAGLAFSALKSGAVGMAGNTGHVLEHTLGSLRDLVNRSLSEVRLASGTQYRRRFRVAEFVEEVEIAGLMEAEGFGNKLVVDRPNFDWVLEMDRQLLASAMANLVQNALKFTKPGTTVFLRTSASATRIAFEIEDQCGGLPIDKIEALFQPYRQVGSNQTGMGLGLSISRKAIEANDGTLTARDVPGKGCIFRVELPLAPPVPSTVEARAKTKAPS